MGAGTAPSLRAEIEAEFSIAGLDTVLLVDDFATTYRVDIADFDFTGLISPEGLDSIGCLLIIPRGLCWLGVWLLKLGVALLVWPVASGLARRIRQWPTPACWVSAQPPALTVGDFVASAAAGRFVRREQVRFRLVTAS